MKTKKILNYKYSHILFGFLMPVVFLLFLMLMFQVYPISYSAATPYDAKHQYLSFLQEYKNKLLGGESLFFSKRMASTDFYIEWLYYLTSPFNLIVLFIKDIVIAFQTIFVIKIGFIGASIAAYLKKRYGGSNRNIILFSCAYSLSSYVMSYYFSIMWLDILMLFPWLLYAFDKMMVKKDTWLYPLLLGAVIYSNFYMAMHVCIFLCIYFLLYKHKNIKMFFVNGVRFTLYSLLGGGIGAAFFMPFIPLLKDKHGSISLEVLCGFDELFIGFGAMAKKQVSMSYSSNANYYCGLITFILFILYLTNKRFSIYERVKYGTIVGFLFLCTNVSYLDFFINGFYKTKGYMGRYTYILIFFILCGAYQEFLSLRDEKPKKIIITMATIAMLFGSSFLSIYIKDGIDKNCMYNLIGTFAVLVCASFILLTRQDKKNLLYVLVMELMMTSICNFKAADLTVLLEDKRDIEALYQDTEARSTLLDMEIHNEEVLNNMNGQSLFSSSLPEVVSTVPYRVGLRGGNNYITAIGCELFPALLYNIEYIYGTDEEYLGFTKIDEYGGRGLFKNNYASSYAYKVPKNIVDWDWNTLNTFRNINDFIGFFINHAFFDVVAQEDVDYESDYESLWPKLTDRSSSQYYEFEKGDGTYVEASITLTRPEIAVNIKHGWFDSCKIYLNDEIYMDDKSIEGDMIYIKGAKAGDEVRVVCDSKKDNGKIYIMFAYYNMDVYEEFAEEMKSRIIPISFEDNEIKGSYEIGENELVFLSIPNIDGWDLKTNGASIETKDFPFIVFRPDRNDGIFSAKYVTPLFRPAICITITSLFITLVLYLLQQKKRRAAPSFLL